MASWKEGWKEIELHLRDQMRTDAESKHILAHTITITVWLMAVGFFAMYGAGKMFEPKLPTNKEEKKPMILEEYRLDPLIQNAEQRTKRLDSLENVFYERLRKKQCVQIKHDKHLTRQMH